MEINERAKVLGGLQSKLENSSRDVYLTGKDAVAAVTAEEKAALVEEEFTGHSDRKKYAFKVKLVKEGEDLKALSAVGTSICDVIDMLCVAGDFDGWEVVSVNRGSIIDIC